MNAYKIVVDLNRVPFTIAIANPNILGCQYLLRTAGLLVLTHPISKSQADCVKRRLCMPHGKKHTEAQTP